MGGASKELASFVESSELCTMLERALVNYDIMNRRSGWSLFHCWTTPRLLIGLHARVTSLVARSGCAALNPSSSRELKRARNNKSSSRRMPLRRLCQLESEKPPTRFVIRKKEFPPPRAFSLPPQYFSAYLRCKLLLS